MPQRYHFQQPNFRVG